MKYISPVIFTTIAIIGLFLYYNYEFKEHKLSLQVREVTRLKDKIVMIHDTITNVEVRLKKAKEVHDTVTILKEQDTLIKFLTVETKLQDTVIKKQDTIIVSCQDLLKEQKRKKRIGVVIGTATGFAAGYLVGKYL